MSKPDDDRPDPAGWFGPHRWGALLEKAGDDARLTIAALEESGFVVVPMKPSAAMIDAGYAAWDRQMSDPEWSIATVWHAMRAAGALPFQRQEPAPVALLRQPVDRPQPGRDAAPAAADAEGARIAALRRRHAECADRIRALRAEIAARKALMAERLAQLAQTQRRGAALIVATRSRRPRAD